MAAKKQTLSNLLLDAVLRNATYTGGAAVYAALYTVAPTATTLGTEVVTGTAYNRIAATFAAAAAGATSNSGAVTFPAASGGAWGTVVAAAICASVTPGTNDHLYFGNLTASKVVGDGDQLNFAIGALSVSES